MNTFFPDKSCEAGPVLVPMWQKRSAGKADFTSKMSIALKEANETQYWLKLLYRTDYISQRQYESIAEDMAELLKILTAICKASVQK